jgi:hypothetical protein
MTAVTIMGCTVDPDELRGLADRLDAGERGAIGAVATLPGYVLTPKTLASGLDVIAARLRSIADFAERHQRGETWLHRPLRHDR